MTVGKAPHVILGQEMLKPKDGSGKDEGELTGGKRLIERLRKRHGHFADVIVADALYLNAPFIKTLKENGLVEVEVIAEVSARLIVNRAAFKLRAAQVAPLVEGFRAAAEAQAA